MSDEAQRLLNEGRALLKDNKRSQAVDSLKKAVELDSENIDVWTALAQALDDRDEKRIAITTLLQLDPANDFAQNELEELEKPTKRDLETAAEWIPGVTRKELRTAILGLTVFSVLVLGIAFLFVSGQNGNIAAQRSELTQVAVVGTQAQTDLQGTQTQAALLLQTQAVDATQTLLAQVSPTPTPTNTPARVLPTAIPPTLTPSETPDTSRIAPPPPANMAGRIVATGGRINTSTEFRELLVYAAGGGESTEINNDLVQSPTVDNAYTRVVYSRAVSGGGVSLLTINTADPNPLMGVDIINPLFAVNASDPRNPNLTRDGLRLVVTALIGDKRVVFLYDYGTSVLTRITPDDGADYTDVAISPDGTLVVAVKKATTGTDLMLIAATDQQNLFPQTPLTNDGDSTVEANPSFSPDGIQVVYSASTSTTVGADLFIGALAGTTFSTVSPLTSTSGNDILPVFSPDGANVAFTSDATGVGNIYIFDLVNRTLYQLTQETSEVQVGGWAN